MVLGTRTATWRRTSVRTAYHRFIGGSSGTIDRYRRWLPGPLARGRVGSAGGGSGGPSIAFVSAFQPGRGGNRRHRRGRQGAHASRRSGRPPSRRVHGRAGALRGRDPAPPPVDVGATPADGRGGGCGRARRR